MDEHVDLHRDRSLTLRLILNQLQFLRLLLRFEQRFFAEYFFVDDGSRRRSSGVVFVIDEEVGMA